MKVRRIVEQGEAISDGAPLVFQERKEGVAPEYNVRTDRWELAVEAMDKVTANELAKREDVPGSKKTDNGPKPGNTEGNTDGGGETGGKE